VQFRPQHPALLAPSAHPPLFASGDEPGSAFFQVQSFPDSEPPTWAAEA
jgi:hypothetical protein